MSLATAFLLIAGASSTACSSSKSEDGPQPEASPSAKVPSAEELKKALLVLADMPTGYAAGEQETSTPEPEGSSSVNAATTECDRLFNEFDNSTAAEQAEVSVQFEKSATGPVVKHTLESYRDAAALQKALTQIREAVDKCREFTVKEDDRDARVEIATASFPKLGDDTAAFKLQATVTSGGRKLVIGGYFVAVRVGNVISTIISFGLGPVDAGEVEQITRKAVDKVTPIAR